MSKCIKCGSYAFNLYKEEIDQGGLCDVHYWQGRAHRAEALAEQLAQQQEPVACKTLCELCVKRGYHFCANAAQTTPIPSPPASKPWVGLTDEEILEAWCIHLDEGDEDEIEEWRHVINEAREIEAKLKEKNT